MEPYVEPRGADVAGQGLQVVQPGVRRSSTRSSPSRSAPSSRRISARAVAAGLLDVPQRLVLLATGRQPVPDSSDLENHHADGVGDDVVELAGHPGSLLGHRQPGGRLAFLLGAQRALLGGLRLLVALAQAEARRARRRANSTGVKMRSAELVRWGVVDHDGRADQHEHQTEPRLRCPRRRPPSRKAAHIPARNTPGWAAIRSPSRKLSAGATTQTNAGARKGTAAGPAAASDHEADRGHLEPELRALRPLGVGPQHGADCARHRRDHDQHVEPLGRE